MIKEQFREILNASGESWFGFIILCALASAVTLGVTAGLSDHKVRCYYLNSVPTSGGVSYKIISDIDWMADETAFASFDEEKVLAVMSNLKQCASK